MPLPALAIPIAAMLGGAALSAAARTNSTSSGGGMATPSKGRGQKFPIYGPQQQRALNQLLRQGLQQKNLLGRAPNIPGLPGLTKAPILMQPQQIPQLLQQLGLDFAPQAQAARTQFYGQTLPGLAERYTAMGGTGRSGAFGNLLGQQSGQFEQGLAALGSQYGLQAGQLGGQLQSNRNQQALSLYELMNELPLRRFGLGTDAALRGQQLQRSGIGSLLGLGLQPRFNTFFQPGAAPQPGFFQNLGAGLGQGLGQLGSLGAAYGFGLI